MERTTPDTVRALVDHKPIAKNKGQLGASIAEASTSHVAAFRDTLIELRAAPASTLREPVGAIHAHGRCDHVRAISDGVLDGGHVRPEHLGARAVGVGDGDLEALVRAKIVGGGEANHELGAGARLIASSSRLCVRRATGRGLLARSARPTFARAAAPRRPSRAVAARGRRCRGWGRSFRRA